MINFYGYQGVEELLRQLDTTEIIEYPHMPYELL
jgi:hypothetical protein